jgi:hypothetical protein
VSEEVRNISTAFIAFFLLPSAASPHKRNAKRQKHAIKINKNRGGGGAEGQTHIIFNEPRWMFLIFEVPRAFELSLLQNVQKHKIKKKQGGK